MSKLGECRWIVSLRVAHVEKRNQNMRWWNDTALAYTLGGIAFPKMIGVGKAAHTEMPQTPMQSSTPWMQGKP